LNYSLTTTYSVPSNSKTRSYRSGNVIEDVLQSFIADTEPEQQLAYEDLKQIEKLDLEKMDLKWQMAMLSKDEYEVWAMKMEYWITNNDINIWKVIQNGNNMKRTGRDHDGSVIILPPTTAEEHIAIQRESKARTTLLQSIPDDHVADFHYLDDAKDTWNAVKARFGGNAESKKMRKSMLKQEFLEFRIRKEEGLHKGYDRMLKILSQLNQLKAKPDAEDINLKFLKALPSSWSQMSKDIVPFL
nr:xylulose kinase-1 [Tanacetum cinerariifolium]